MRVVRPSGTPGGIDVRLDLVSTTIASTTAVINKLVRKQAVMLECSCPYVREQPPYINMASLELCTVDYTTKFLFVSCQND